MIQSIKEWFKSADEYCFGYGSPTALGLIRMFGAFVVFLNLLMISVFWKDWFSEQGYVPAWMGAIWFPDRTPLPGAISKLAPNGIPRIDLLYGVTDPRITMGFYFIVTLAALLTSLGLFTRISAFVLAVGLVTLHHRNGAILHGGDTAMRLVVIYLAVTPCGRACSLDRLIGVWKGKIGNEPELISLWGQRLFAFNTALIYFTSVWLKWDGDKWRNLTATYYPERLAEFYRFPIPEFFKSMWMAKIGTLFAVATEFSMATLVFFPPARKYVLVGGILMHSWIEYSMNIPLFSFIMLSTYWAFFQGEEIQAWAQRTGMRLRRFHVIVRLPSGRQLTPNAATFLSAIDPFGLVAYLPGQTERFEAVRIDETAIPVAKAIATRSLGGWLFFWLPGEAERILGRSTEPVPVAVNRAEVSPQPAKEQAGLYSRRKRR